MMNFLTAIGLFKIKKIVLKPCKLGEKFQFTYKKNPLRLYPYKLHFHLEFIPPSAKATTTTPSSSLEVGKKRKISSATTSPAEGHTDEPPAKRSKTPLISPYARPRTSVSYASNSLIDNKKRAASQ